MRKFPDTVQKLGYKERKNSGEGVSRSVQSLWRAVWQGEDVYSPAHFWATREDVCKPSLERCG